MGQGLYRMLGWGCLNPLPFNWDGDEGLRLYDLVKTSYECKPDYIVIPLAVDDEWLQQSWNLAPLPQGGLPHVEPRTARIASRCQWWPDVEKTGVWIDRRIVATWELVQKFALTKGLELPDGHPVFLCDWD